MSAQPNTPETVLLDILDNDYSNWTIKVCLVASSDSEDEAVVEVNIMQIGDAVTGAFQRTIRDCKLKIARLYKAEGVSLEEYDPSPASDESEIEYVSRKAAPAEHGVIYDQLAHFSDLENVEDFANNNDFIKRLNYYVVVAEKEGCEPVYFLSQFTKSKELSRSKRFGVYFTDGQYDTFRETLFLFDNSVDCFISQGYSYILSKSKFQYMFKFTDLIKQQARDALQAIEETNLIAGIETMKGDVGRSFMQGRKIARLQKSGHLATLTIADVRQLIVRTPELATVLLIEGEQIIYSSDSLSTIIKVLHGEVWYSEITKDTREANKSRKFR